MFILEEAYRLGMVATVELIVENAKDNVYRVTVTGNRFLEDFNKTGPGIWIKDFSNFKNLGIEGQGEIPMLDAEEGYDVDIERNEYDQLEVFTVDRDDL